MTSVFTVDLHPITSVVFPARPTSDRTFVAGEGLAALSSRMGGTQDTVLSTESRLPFLFNCKHDSCCNDLFARAIMYWKYYRNLITLYVQHRPTTCQFLSSFCRLGH